MLILTRARSSNNARLFQQACRFGSTRSRPPLPSREKEGQSHNGTVRWFEQDLTTGSINRLPGNPDESETDRLREQIRELRAQLKAYDADPNSDEFTNTILEELEPEEREKARKALARQRAREASLTNGLEVDEDPSPLARPLIRRFNATLKDAALHPRDHKRRKDLWLWYNRLKNHVAGFPRSLPQRAWDVMWKTQSVSTIENRNRDAHVIELLDDLTNSGKTPTDAQNMARLEALIALGRTHDAIAEWKQDSQTSNSFSSPVLVRGIHLFCRVGDLSRATDITRQYFHHFPDGDSRLLLPLIRANTAAAQYPMAYAIYMVMRSKLRTDMTMQDYDECIAIFLQAGVKDLALAVFRDMMLQGNRAVQIGAVVGAAVTKLRSAFQSRIQGLLQVDNTDDSINKISLSVLSSLPSRWQNKYFYASWIKKLIGANELGQAAQVVELMQERGVQPDPIHMNGLIGAYFRSGDQELQIEAERLAWGMIAQRKSFEAQRGSASESLDAIRTSDPASDSVLLPTAARQAVETQTPARRYPVATAETFNVLALFYLIKDRRPAMRLLERQLRKTRLKMPTYFLNKLLYMQLYANGAVSTWRDFTHYTGLAASAKDIKKGVRADLETFDVLWTAMLRHLKDPHRASAEEFPRPRLLMRYTVAWHGSVTDKKANKKPTPELYVKILQSFVALKDYGGCLVAMHVLACLLDTYPSAETVGVLADGIANIPERKRVPTIRVGNRVRRQIVTDKRRGREVAALIDSLSRKRAETARRLRGVEIQSLTGQARLKENLDLLSELVRVVMVRAGGGGVEAAEEIERSIADTSRELGVEGISTGDVDAGQVARDGL